MGRSGHGGERIAVARDDAVLAARHRRGEELLKAIAAHFVRRACFPKSKARRFHRSAIRTGEHFADRNAEPLQMFADSLRFGASFVGEIALGCAILVARHSGVVLAEVGRRVAHVEHVAALAQFLNDRRVDLGRGWKR
jgi:hypothetical protein